MSVLSDRQTKILKAIIDDYIATAEPVGSVTIEKKFSLGVSPATIRNEMVRLTDEGFLKQVHSSSGRVPTPMALKYYVTNLMKEQTISVAEEVAVKEKVWDYRHDTDRLLREVTRELAIRTKELAIASTDNGELYVAGIANILEAPEFFDIDLTRALLSHLDEVTFWNNLTSRTELYEKVGILLGDDLGDVVFEPCGFIYTRFDVGKTSGTIGVIGPARANYCRIYPTVKYFRTLIDEVFQGW